MSQNQDGYFSPDCQTMLGEIFDVIKQSIDEISKNQKKLSFQRYIGQEIYWILNKWLETLFQQNFTHITKQLEENVKQFLNGMKNEFNLIKNYVSELKYDRKAGYVEQFNEIKNIIAGFQNLLKLVNQQLELGNIKIEHATSKAEYESFLSLAPITESMLTFFDDQYQKSLQLYGKEIKDGQKEPFNCDITYLIIPPSVANVKVIEVEDLYEGFNNYYYKTQSKKLNKVIHIKKLQFFLDYDNKGQIDKGDIDDFITFVWCNPVERAKFLNEKPLYSGSDTPNKYKLSLSLCKHSSQWDPSFPKIIYIDERGYWNEKKKDREQIRKPVRFGRKAVNNLIPCDVYFGHREMTISKRQFVIKPDFNEYYAYCISTTNPTEFLVKTDGAYITNGSVITLSDKISFVVTECVVPGEEEEKKQMEIETLEEMSGPTVRRGKKNNPALQQIYKQANKLVEIKDQNGYKESGIVEDAQIDEEVTQKEENRTFERKKGGMKEIKAYFQKRINNDVDGLEDNSLYQTQEWKKQKVSVSEPIDYRIIPNRDLVMKDTKKKDQCYIQLKLDWTDLEIDKEIEQQVEAFNKRMKDKNQPYFTIGSAGGCEIVINNPCMKEFHTYFKYLEDEKRWLVMDYNQNILPAAIQKDQYTTVAFKGNHEKNHSELFKLQKGAIIVVSGNFLEVDIVDYNLNNFV